MLDLTCADYVQERFVLAAVPTTSVYPSALFTQVLFPPALPTTLAPHPLLSHGNDLHAAPWTFKPRRFVYMNVI